MVIYIAGRGHSGSTILDFALSRNADIYGTGELLAGFHRPGEVCSCGQKFNECPFWTSVCAHLSDSIPSRDPANVRTLMQRHSKFILVFLSLLTPKSILRTKYRCYLNASKQLYAGIRLVSGANHIVDSSKEIHRAILLGSIVRGVRVIHIVRDPVKMISSNIWRVEQGIGFRFMRRSYLNKNYRIVFIIIGALGWLLGNLALAIGLRLKGSNSLRIRYEDICFKPDNICDRLEKWLGLNLAGTRKFFKGELAIQSSHNLGGNQERKRASIVFNAKRALGRNRLRVSEQKVVKLLTWPLRKYYAY